ncbi:MAG: ABC transporter substrate-binding protein [Myxococcales bacterium]
MAGCARDQAEPAAADTLVVLLPREPDQLDPRYVGDAYGLKLSRLLHASLTRIDPLSLTPEPWLAERVELVTPTRYRVVLRENLRFSDGSSLDADDVVATFRGLVDPQLKTRYASTYRRIRTVRALSPREVEFELGEPHATFITDLEIPILRAEDAVRPANPKAKPVGSGPYVLQSADRGELQLVANRFYSLGQPSFPRLRFVIVRDDNTRALRMLAGAGDLALNVIPPLLVPLFSPPRFRVRTAPGVGTTYVGLNLSHAALSNRQVRTALALAIDREGIVRHKLGGRARLASSFIVPGHWAHASDTPGHAHDPARARELLRAAGYDAARPLSLVLRTGSDRFMVSVARALVSMWQAVGVEVDVRPSESATLLADLARGRFEMTLMQLPEVFEPHTLSWFFASDRVPEPGVREGGNRWRLRNPELDRLLERGRATVVLEQRIPIYRQVQDLLAQELPVIPLWHEDVVAITSSRLEHYVVPRDGRFGTLVSAARGSPRVH